MGNDVRRSLCELGTAAVPLSWQCPQYAGPVNTQRSLAGCHGNRIKYPSGPVTSQGVRTAEWHHLNHTHTANTFSHIISHSLEQENRFSTLTISESVMLVVGFVLRVCSSVVNFL